MKLVVDVWENVYVFYLKFKVGVVVQIDDGLIFVGCNVENVVYFEGICVEVGVIVVMVVVGGQIKIIVVVVIVDCLMLVMFCGGCCQKIVEFVDLDVIVMMVMVDGVMMEMKVCDLLFGVFMLDYMFKVE